MSQDTQFLQARDCCSSLNQFFKCTIDTAIIDENNFTSWKLWQNASQFLTHRNNILPLIQHCYNNA